MRVPMHDSIRMEQQAAAWRVRIKRRLRQRYGTPVIDEMTDGRCEKSWILPPEIQAAVDTLTTGEAPTSIH